MITCSLMEIRGTDISREWSDSLGHGSWHPWAAGGHLDTHRSEAGGTSVPDNMGTDIPTAERFYKTVKIVEIVRS